MYNMCLCSPEMLPTLSDDDDDAMKKLLDRFYEEQDNEQRMKDGETEQQMMTGTWTHHVYTVIILAPVLVITLTCICAIQRSCMQLDLHVSVHFVIGLLAYLYTCTVIMHNTDADKLL